MRSAGPSSHVIVIYSGGDSARGCQARCSRAKRWDLLAPQEGHVAVANAPAGRPLTARGGFAEAAGGTSAKPRMRGQTGTSGFALAGKSPERDAFQGQKPRSQGCEPGRLSVAREGEEQRCPEAQRSGVGGG